MAKTELIDSHVSLDQCRKAVEALHSHETKKKEKFEEGQLLPAKEQNVWLNVTVKTVPSGHKLKPVKIPIVHPLVDPRTSPVCLITKDPQREYKDLLETHNIKFISRVVGIEKLKGKFKPFEARRMLLKENGMFLADERIIPLLPKLLGSKWFEAKKQPIPVCLTRKDLKGELERAISSTYMNQNQGTCTSIKVGKMSQKPSQILDNIKTALPAVAKAIKGNWDNIQSLNIKTNSSVSLPIWSCTLDATEGGRWHGIEAASDDEGAGVADGSDSEEDSDGEATKAKKAPVSKGKKRPSSSDDEEDEAEDQPKKKVKGADGAPSTKGKGKTAPILKAAAKSVDTTTPTKAEPIQSKKRKTPESSSSSAKPTSLSFVTIPSGKKGPKTKTAAAEATLPTESVSKVPESAGKKGKKAQAPSSTQPPTSTPEAPQKKKKTAPVEQAGDSAVPSTRTPSSSAEAPAAAQPAKDKSEKKKTSKKAQDREAAVSAKAVKPILSKDEMKQKRSVGVGEKKKEIVAKSKGGKSAKNAVLGKKVAQV